MVVRNGGSAVIGPALRVRAARVLLRLRLLAADVLVLLDLLM